MHANTRPASFFPLHARKAWLVLLALSALVLLAACGASTTSGSGATPPPTTGSTPTATVTSAAGSGQAVTITTDSSGSFAFSPATLTVKVGTKVTWTNMTQTGHTVTSDDGKSFDSGISNPVASGGTYSFTFTKAGTFPYHCQIHPFMKATITVTS